MPANEHYPEPSGQALPRGTRIEEFVIERVLGSGGFGITYLARDTALGRQVVIKENFPVQFCFRDTRLLTVAPRHSVGEDVENFRWSLANFSREAAILASVDHPGIVKVLRSFEAFGTAYFVMPFVDGITLDELIEERRAKGNPFSEDELLGLLEQVLVALDHLHERGIYHRDIKPANILITDEGIPVLIDFGSARQRLGERSMTVVESAGYTPFEQLQSRGNVGPWSDLYALGGTIEKSITGETPPKAMDRMRRDPRIPLTQRSDLAARYSASLLASIDQALAVEETERWQDAGEWLAALRGGPASAVLPPEPEGARRPQTQKTPGTQRIDPISPTKKINLLPWIIAACVILGLSAWGMFSSNSKIEVARMETSKAEPLKTEQQRLTDLAAAEAEKEQQKLIAQTKAKEEAAKADAARAEQQRLPSQVEKDKQANIEQTKAKEEVVKAEAARAEQKRLADLAAAEAAKIAKATKDQPFVNSLGIKFVPAGTSGVLFGTCLTRVKDFKVFVDSTGYDAITDSPNGAPAYTLKREGAGATGKQVGGNWKDPRFPPGHGQDGEHPVVCVSFLDAEAFCAWLTKHDAAKLPNGWHYRVPTDEEWSTACGPTEFPWGDNYPPGPKDGNYSGTDKMIGPMQGFSNEFSEAGRSDGWARTSPVGRFTANSYGLFDMGGNAWEWCGTWYKASLNDAKTLEAIPALKQDGGGQVARVVRGGSLFNFGRMYLRSEYRFLRDPRYRGDDSGFRVVLVPDGVSPPQVRLPNFGAGEAIKATKDQPFVNLIGMKFVPAGTQGVLFCMWETRLKDFQAFVDATGYDAIEDGPNGTPAETVEVEGNRIILKRAGGTWKDPHFPSADAQSGLHPVVCVSYLDAEAFCVWLTKRDEDLPPSGWHYRLPTDEEWSTACGPTEFPWGNNYPPSPRDGNYSGTDPWARTSPVGSFTPNRYGLFDMGGNAWEYCATWYKSSMNDAKILEAVPGLKNDGGRPLRVVRGAAWSRNERTILRSAYRDVSDPRGRLSCYGFRVVLVGGGR